MGGGKDYIMLITILFSCYPVMLVVSDKLSKKLAQIVKRFRSMTGDRTQIAYDAIQGISVERRMVRDYEEANEAYCHIQKKTNRLTTALERLGNMFDLLGELTAIYTLYGSFRYAFLRIGQYLSQMMNCLVNVERGNTLSRGKGIVLPLLGLCSKMCQSCF